MTVVFASFGVPLMFLFLAQTGDAMANLFRTIYWKYCCILCSPPKKKDIIKPKYVRTRSRYYKVYEIRHKYKIKSYWVLSKLKVLIKYFFSLYTRPLSHPVSAITGSTRSAETNLHSPMGGGPNLISANKLPPFKIGNNLETFSNLVTKYNHAASTQSIATVGKKQRGTVRRAMSVRSRGSDVRKKV